MSPDLRSTLHDAADPSTTGAPDMNAIRARGRQLTYRRRAAVTAVAVPMLTVAAVALLSSAGPLNQFLRPTEAPIPAGPVVSPVVSPSVTPSVAPSVTPTATEPGPGTTVPGVVVPPVEDGRVIVFLRDIMDREVIYDQAQWNDNCDEEFARLEKLLREGKGGVTVDQLNLMDLCIINDNPRLRRAPVSSDVVVMSQPESDYAQRKSLAWLVDFRATTSDASHWPYWLTIEDGVITKIQQVNPHSA